MSAATVVVTAVWAMLPAYVPNNLAVVAGGGRPLDGGRTWRGRRLLGDGKTVRGTAVGLAGGALVALGLNAVRAAASPVAGFGLPFFPPAAVVSLPAGALAGDAVASFVKRRLGRERGAPVPVLDQLDFVAGALVLTAAASPPWFGSVFTPAVVVAVLVLTPVLHVATNLGAYHLGLKAEPW